MNGESGGAFALATKLLHPRPKAMGVEHPLRFEDLSSQRRIVGRPSIAGSVALDQR